MKKITQDMNKQSPIKTIAQANRFLKMYQDGRVKLLNRPNLNVPLVAVMVRGPGRIGYDQRWAFQTLAEALEMAVCELRHP
jgi:hypothetical protein